MSSSGKQLSKDALHQRQKIFLDSSKPFAGPVVIGIDIHTPENIASILRISEAAGCKQCIFVADENQIITSKISRIARSADKHMNVEFMTFEQLYDIKDQLPPLCAIEITSQSISLYETNLDKNIALVIGSERHGLNENVLQLCDLAIHIPMYGINSSMNVSHALAIVLFEWRRQFNN